MSKRGIITKEIQKIAKKHIGREISQNELRLLAYVQYVMMNEQKLDIQKINQGEREILSKWKKEDLCEGGACGLSITKKFWDFMSEVLWEGYVVGGSVE